jgi:anthranilate synthase/aminodeoxychorismate synthase-like glutamine amidotransferase
MNVLVVDNYDSFTYNLVHYLEELGARVAVLRNDALPPAAALRGGYDRVLISPGPGRPERAGISLPLVQSLAGQVPILGVCLGHQALGEAFGARVIRAPEIRHGKTSAVHHDGRTLYRGLPNPFLATRYHSLVLDPERIPGSLEVSAQTADGVIMGIRHRDLPLEGVQFHPESILTEGGKRLLGNFLNR